MATTIKKRGTDKRKKTLFVTCCTPKINVNDHNLDAMLARYEKIVKKILTAEGLPATWPGILEYTKNFDLPIQASYAADILALIFEVRKKVEKGDAENAAYQATKLGFYIASSDAELIRASRATRNTKPAQGKKAEPSKARRLKMQKIAEDLCHWKEGTFLTEEQWKEVKTAFRKTFSVINRPTPSTILKDAHAIGLRPKPKK